MSKIIYLYSRYRDINEGIKGRLKSISNCLIPDNIKTSPVHEIFSDGKNAYAVTMQKHTFRKVDSSILLGHLYEEDSYNWTIPHSKHPNGNYAIFRNNENHLEIVSDAAGTRTVWYYFDDNYFLASTSQRAIIMFLGSFEFDERVIPWMLSTGTLGPELSWDKRIHRLQPASTVTLNKHEWEISTSKEEIDFSPVQKSKKKLMEHIDNKIRSSLKQMDSLEFEKWILPLSGGYDSRGILCYIKEEIPAYKKVKSVTWGVKKSLDEDGNDAKIARDLAKKTGVDHEYLLTDVSKEPIETVLNRFIFCSEGRIDHISAYMDGMEIWRKFYDNDVTGVIRGDEGFGWSEVSSELTVRLSIGCMLCTDFKNLKDLHSKFGIPKQEFPKSFTKKRSETLGCWRDRLYHSFRLPSVLAALSDIKFSYVEQITPLLSKDILEAVRKLPDKYRTNKKLFKQVVDAISPDIPYASKSAVANTDHILKRRDLIDLIKSELHSKHSKKIFNEGFVNFVSDSMNEDSGKNKKETALKKIVNFFKKITPAFIKRWLRDQGISPELDGNKLAFRVYLIIKMHKLLHNDKKICAKN